MFNLWSTSGGLLWQTELVDKSEEAWRPPGGLATHGSLAATHYTQNPQNAVKHCSSITTESKYMKCVHSKGGSSETHKQPHSFPFSCPPTSSFFWWVIRASMEGGAPQTRYTQYHQRPNSLCSWVIIAQIHHSSETNKQQAVRTKKCIFAYIPEKERAFDFANSI